MTTRSEPQREDQVDELVVVATCGHPAIMAVQPALVVAWLLVERWTSGAVMSGSGVEELTSLASGGSCSRPESCCGVAAGGALWCHCAVRQRHGTGDLRW